MKPTDTRGLTQFSHWIRSDLAQGLKERADRQDRFQRDLIEEAIVDLLVKPDPLPASAVPAPHVAKPGGRRVSVKG